jgi:regulator of replication initiation timing
MKKFVFLSLLGLPVLFLWGCSLINNNDSWINTWDIEKISQLEQQLSWLLEQFSWIQAENESLKETLSWSLISIQALQSENETLQTDVDKYKKMIVEDKLSSKDQNIQKEIITYNNSKYWLSFDYPKNRNLITEEWNDPQWDIEKCSLKLSITLTDKTKPLQCFEAWCTPNIQPSIWIQIWETTGCQRLTQKCSDVPSNTKAMCEQLKNLWISEFKAAKTTSFWWWNWGSNYSIIQWAHWYTLKWSFVDWIVEHFQAFLIEKNWYGVQIIDGEWMYKDIFDDFIKTFNYN